tara:strand:+ start:365 stop:508 length:144 start_codon:yes stop_codon:yes gene_type:complete
LAFISAKAIYADKRTDEDKCQFIIVKSCKNFMIFKSGNRHIIIDKAA